MTREPHDPPISAVTRRRLLQMGGAAGLGLLLVPGLAGCGGDDDGSTGTTTGGTTGTTVAGSDPATTAPGATTGETTTTAGGAPSNIDRTAILKYGQMRGESYDPIRAVAVEDVQLNCLFDTLLTIDPGTGELGPRLATKWDVMDDRVRLTLRDGVTFQDGTPFDADAVKFSLDRAKTDPDSNITSFLPQLASVEVVDPATVDLVLSPMQVLPLLIRLTGRAGMIVSPTAVQAAGSSEAFSNAPVGTGMYKIEGQWFPRESMSVRAWDGYWDKDAQTLGGIDFIEVALGGKVNAILSGAVDMISVEASDIDAVDGQADTKVDTGTGGLGRGIILNTTMAPLDDEKVRQAIACAIDRDAAVQAITNGRGTPAFQLFNPESPAYDKELDSLYTYDLDRAKQLLADAGHADGVTFGSVIGSTAGVYVTFAQFVQAQLAKAGITMDLELVDQPRTIPMLYRERTAASSVVGGAGVSAANTDIVIRNSFLADGTTNASGTDVPGVRELIDQAAAQADVASAAEFYQGINKIITEGQYTISVLVEPTVIARKEYIGGLTRAFADTDTNPNLLRGIYITEGKEAVED